MQPGMRRRAVRGLVISLVGLATLSSVALAQPAMPEPPDIAAEVLADPLTAETVFAAGACGGGKGSGRYAEEGFRLETTGTCGQEGAVVAVSVPGRGITIADGDVSVAFKITGTDGRRAALHLTTRVSGPTWVGAFVQPSSGVADLYQVVDGVYTALMTHDDGQLPLAVDSDWNRMSLRVAGGDAWLLLNDWPVLHASGVPEGAGGVGVRLVRVGARGNDESAAVTLADLLVSPIAGGDPGRSPIYQQP